MSRLERGCGGGSEVPLRCLPARHLSTADRTRAICFVGGWLRRECPRSSMRQSGSYCANEYLEVDPGPQGRENSRPERHPSGVAPPVRNSRPCRWPRPGSTPSR